MRLWHVAGIRPVSSRLTVCCARRQLHPIGRLNRLNRPQLSLRYKSSTSATHDPDAHGHDESDKGVDKAIHDILRSLNKPAPVSTPLAPKLDTDSTTTSQTSLPTTDTATATASLASIGGDAAAKSPLLVDVLDKSGQPNQTPSSQDPSPKTGRKARRKQHAKRRASKKKRDKEKAAKDKQKAQGHTEEAQGHTEKAQGHTEKAQGAPQTQAKAQEQRDHGDAKSVQPSPTQPPPKPKTAKEPAATPMTRRRATRQHREFKMSGTINFTNNGAPVRLSNPRESAVKNLSVRQAPDLTPDVEEGLSSIRDETPFLDPAQPKTLREALQGRVLEPSSFSEPSLRLKKRMSVNIEHIKAAELDLTPLPIHQPPVPRLSHGLDRVLFNRGVYQLQDPYSMVYNFDPYIQKIMPVAEFDYNALAEYKTSSQDTLLSDIAQEHNIKYVGSTSSMTSTLGHFHYLLSNWRNIDLGMLSKDFPETSTTFTEINRAPNAMFLRRKNGVYAIDADKEYDGANVLMLLGKSLEKLLTMPADDFERYRKSDPRQIPDAERNAPDSYHFSTQGDFLMRSQLDAYDPRLPGTGMFDLKTRAVISVRMQSADYEEMSGYELHKQHGRFESYEREYYDMSRSTMLKYSLQARMGRMDGIFVAYHNVKRIFGFQYLNLNEMDRALHGQTDRSLGNQEFGLSIELLNKVLNEATERFPDQVRSRMPPTTDIRHF